MESFIWFIFIFTIIAIPAFYLYASLQNKKDSLDKQIIDNMDMEMECCQIDLSNLNIFERTQRKWESFIVMIGLGRFFFLQVVPSEQAWIIDRHGVDRVACEGINRIVPGLDKVEEEDKLDLKEQESDPDPQTITTKDNINIEVDMYATFKIIKPMKAVKEVENYKEKLKTVIENSTYTILAGQNFEDIQKNTIPLLNEIKKHASITSERWGIEMMEMSFQSLTLPKELVEAEQKKIIAEREREAAVIEAKGKHEVMTLNAKSEGVLIEQRAEATRNAIEKLKHLMPELSDEKIMQFLTSNAYIDSMRELSSSSNSKFVLYPSDVQQPMDKVMNAEYMSQAMKKTKK